MGKKTKKITKQSKRRLALLGPISIIMVIVTFYNTINSTYKQLTLKEEEEHLKHELVELKEKEEELRNEVLKLQDNEYLARYARETYLYTKDGEYVIKINKIQEKKLDKTDFIYEYKNYIILSIIALLIILIVIIKNIIKSKKIEVS